MVTFTTFAGVALVEAVVGAAVGALVEALSGCDDAAFELFDTASDDPPPPHAASDKASAITANNFCMTILAY
jgi:hypothetical protein